MRIDKIIINSILSSFRKYFRALSAIFINSSILKKNKKLEFTV